MSFARWIAGLFVAGVSLAQSKTEPQSRSWTQPFGDALGTSFVDVAPLRSAPEENKLDLGTVIGEPVVWDGAVFVLVQSSGVQLRAYEVATRKLIKSVGITGEAPSSLIVWNTRAALLTNAGLSYFDFQRDAKTWTEGPKIELAGSETPRVFGGTLLCAAANKVSVATLDKAVVRTSFDMPRGPSALRPFSAFGPAAHATVVASGGKWILRVVELDRFDSPKLAVLGHSDIELGPGPDQLPSDVQLVRLQPVGGSGAWLVARSDGSQLVIEGAQAKVVAAPFVGPVAANAGSAFGFDANGALMRLETSGSASTVAAASSAPHGWITIARDVAYTAGRAIDLANGKELWTTKRFGADGRAIPAGDQRLITIEGKGALVFLGPKASKKASDSGAAAIPRPGDGPGLVKSDGTRLAGNAERSERGWRLLSDEGGTLAELTDDEVALVENDGGVQLVGPELAVHRAWRNALDVEHRERLLEVFALFMKQRLVDDGRRLLAEAKSCGLDKAKITELEGVIAKTKANENSNKDAQRKAPLAKEVEARKASRAAFIEAADWCRNAGLILAASMLEVDTETIAPNEGNADAALKELLPEAFPWRDQADAIARWKKWVPHLIRVGAHFVPKSDKVWNRLKGSPWTQGVVVLESEHVMLCSRDETPEVVGGCLLAAEEAMRLLHTIVPPEKGAPTEPLLVRLLATKDEYMRQGAPDFTLGYYSPSEKLSRFYVPDGNEGKDVLGRGLYSTVAHELTHHYLDVAWLGPDTQRQPQTSTMPGYWIVEGFATFVQDDVVAKLRARDGLPPRDPTCAYLAKGANGNGKLMPFSKLLEMTNGEFQKLGKEPLFDVPAPNDSGMVVKPAEVNIFYEQSAALVFFLNYKAGPDHRAKLGAYVRAQYLGELKPEGWKAIGYAQPQELDTAFHKYLQSTE